MIIVNKNKSFLPIPYFIELNGVTIGMMRGKKVQITNLKKGQYRLGIKTGFVFRGKEIMLKGMETVTIDDEHEFTVEFENHERIWNILFDIDVLLWIAEFFITLPHPWHTVYEVLSNGFFMIWLVRLYLIRNKYFKLKTI